MAVSLTSFHAYYLNKLFIVSDSAQIVQAPASGAMKVVPAKDASSMVFWIRVSMAKEKRERKASSVGHTDARIKMVTAILVKPENVFMTNT